MRPYQYIGVLFITILLVLCYLYVMDIVSFLPVIFLWVVYLAILGFGITQIQLNYYIPSLNHGDQDKKRVALTFDDGPTPETAAILDILKEHHVPSAFFCIGKNIHNEPELARRMHDEGHILGNHSYYHTPSFDWKSSRSMQQEIRQCNEAIQQVTGKQPVLFRPPYGVTNPNLSRAVLRTGMVSVGWTLRSFDTVIKDPVKLKKRILDRLKNGDIILLHDTVPLTREILTEIISSAREKGFTFARIDELLHIEAYRHPGSGHIAGNSH